MKIKKPNMKRLASLSALGVGALGAIAGPAEAGIIYSGTLDENIGFGPGYGTKATIAGPGGADGILDLQVSVCNSPCGAVFHLVELNAHQGVNGTNFLLQGNRNSIPWAASAYAFPQGAEFGPSSQAPIARFGYIAKSSVQAFITTFQQTNFNSTDRYLLFTFGGGDLPQRLYGWAQFSVAPIPGNFSGPDVTLIDWAYDNSGAQIPAGDTGTPEPSTFALTGLSALALGAAGLRSWRAARKTA
jgi:hypothetical protein